MGFGPAQPSYIHGGLTCSTHTCMHGEVKLSITIGLKYMYIKMLPRFRALFIQHIQVEKPFRHVSVLLISSSYIICSKINAVGSTYQLDTYYGQYTGTLQSTRQLQLGMYSPITIS